MRLNHALPLRSRISEIMTRRPGKADSPAEQLNRWRREIDDLDEVILEALELRARTVREIGRYKKDNGLPILDATRERFILDRVVEKSGLLPTEVRGEIFAHMIQRMREWESTLD